jgi:hypothetical protein
MNTNQVAVVLFLDVLFKRLMIFVKCVLYTKESRQMHIIILINASKFKVNTINVMQPIKTMTRTYTKK